MALTYVLTVRTNFGLSGSQAATAGANLCTMTAFYLVAGRLARAMRNTAGELVVAQDAAVERARLLVAAEKRDDHNRVLHDRVLQTIEAIAKHPDADAMRSYARRGAAEVRSILRDDVPEAGVNLVAALGTLAEEFAGEGLNLELVTAEVQTSPPGPVIEALTAATREALRNVVKHAHTQRVVVWASAGPTRVELSIRDHGIGVCDGFVGRWVRRRWSEW